MMTIEEMKQRKKQLGLSYERIAEDSQLSVATIKKIFSGETETPRYETLYALSETLGPGKWKLAESVAVDYDAKSRTYTIDDYYSFPDDARCELIDGVIYDMSTPTQIHQIISEELGDRLRVHIRENGGKCRASALPTDTILSKEDNYTIVQPDVFVVCDPSKFTVKGIIGAPDLAIEVLSPSTRKKDQTVKLDKYRSVGVKEYWMVDPEIKRIYIHYFEEENRIGFYTFRDDIPVGIFDNKLVIHFSEIDDYVENFVSLCQGENV